MTTLEDEGKNRLVNTPAVIASATIPTPKTTETFLPCKSESTPSVVTLLAGPANKKASAAPGETPAKINAAANGKVSFVGQRSGYGNVVEMTHGNGIMTRYAHLSGFAAHIGDKVARGETIGRMGSTGRSTGPHLHFEVRLNGQAINPRRFLEARKDVLQVQQIAKARFADVGNRG